MKSLQEEPIIIEYEIERKQIKIKDLSIKNRNESNYCSVYDPTHYTLFQGEYFLNDRRNFLKITSMNLKTLEINGILVSFEFISLKLFKYISYLEIIWYHLCLKKFLDFNFKI